jgi:hypothetical protein
MEFEKRHRVYFITSITGEMFRSVKASSLEQKCRHEGTVTINSQILSFRSRRRRNLRHHGVREATSCLLHHKRRPQKKLALVETRNLPAWTCGGLR